MARLAVSFPQILLELCDLGGQLVELPHYLGSVQIGFRGCTCAPAVQKALGQRAGQQRDEADAGGHYDGCDQATQSRCGVDVSVGHGRDGLRGPPEPVPGAKVLSTLDGHEDYAAAYNDGEDYQRRVAQPL